MVCAKTRTGGNRYSGSDSTGLPAGAVPSRNRIRTRSPVLLCLPPRSGQRVPGFIQQQRIYFFGMNQDPHFPTRDQRSFFDRREFLWRFGGGLGGIAFAHLLGQEGLLAEGKLPLPKPEWNGGLHHQAKA